MVASPLTSAVEAIVPLLAPPLSLVKSTVALVAVLPTPVLFTSTVAKSGTDGVNVDVLSESFSVDE